MLFLDCTIGVVPFFLNYKYIYCYLYFEILLLLNLSRENFDDETQNTWGNEISFARHTEVSGHVSTESRFIP